jgi:hypothetical protein
MNCTSVGGPFNSPHFHLETWTMCTHVSWLALSIINIALLRYIKEPVNREGIYREGVRENLREGGKLLKVGLGIAALTAGVTSYIMSTPRDCVPNKM